MLEISSETVKPMPATVPPPAFTGQLSARRTRRRDNRQASQVAPTMPSGLPSTYPKKMPSVTGDDIASPSSELSTWMPALASANSGTIAKLVHGCRRCWRRSLGEIADATASCAERASSGVGCSRNERVRSTTRSRSTRAGGYELVISPTASPAITGSIPDSSSATQTATPSSTAARPRHAGGANRSANNVANRAAATASATTSTCSV